MFVIVTLYSGMKISIISPSFFGIWNTSLDCWYTRSWASSISSSCIGLSLVAQYGEMGPFLYLIASNIFPFTPPSVYL